MNFVVLYRNEIWIKQLFIVLGLLKHERASPLAISATVRRDDCRKIEQAIFVQDFNYLQQKVGL